MSFTLSISINNVSFNEVDLFQEQELFYDVSFYDDVEIDKIKIPFYTSLNIPLTATNKNLFGYNPVTDDAINFPLSEYYFKINVHNSSSTQINGVLTVSSIEYNSDAPYMEVELKDFITVFMTDLNSLGIGDVLTDSYYSTQHTFDDFTNTTANNGEAGTPNVAPDFTRPVNFPYVDLANDTLKFSYEARHFTEYGAGMSRSCFIPTLSIKNYLEEIGNYLSNSNRPVEVRSKLFGINDTVFNSDFEPEKLQAVIPAKLLAVNSVNTRQFQLTHGPDRVRPNEDLDISTNLDGSTKLMRTLWYGTGESFGNYGSTGTSYQKYGVKVQETYSTTVYSLANETWRNELGYFCPHMSFRGRVQYLSGDRFESTGVIDFHLPTIAEDKMVYKINKNSSDMKFGLFVCIYEDGYLKREIRLNDSNGDAIELDISNATVARSNASKDQNQITSFSADFLADGQGNIRARINTLTYPGIADKLEFPSVDVYLPVDETIDLDISGESRYGTSIVLKPIYGQINIEYVSSYGINNSIGGYDVKFADAMSTDSFEVEDIRKAKTDITNFDDLNLLIKAIEDYNLYFLNDEFVIKDSLNETTELSPVDIIKHTSKRFGCGLFYEFENNTHILRIDPIHFLRNNTINGDYYLDDAVSIKLSRPSDIIKNLIVSNEDKNLFYDKYREYDDYTAGTINQVINENGVNDYLIELKSSVYRNSLCGSIFFQTNQNIDLGIVSPSEAGLTDNIFTSYKDIGIRFAYLTKPLYRTNLKVPYSIETSKRPNLLTTTQRIYVNMYDYDNQTELYKHTFNGRLTNVNSSGFDLLGEDKNKNTTDYYDLISNTEQVTSKGKASVELNLVIPVSSLSTTKFMLDKYSLSLVNGQNILIKSAEGQVYNNNAYLSVKGLIE